MSGYDPTVEFIRAKGRSLNDGLKKEEQADMRAYMALVENVLVNAEAG